jgi:hypothetical protein
VGRDPRIPPSDTRVCFLVAAVDGGHRGRRLHTIQMALDPDATVRSPTDGARDDDYDVTLTARFAGNADARM